MTADLMLPTWEAASKMRFDCQDAFCKAAADGWLSGCNHGLVVCHQLLDGPRKDYQAVIRHGESEGVLVIRTGDDDLLALDGEVREWLDRVHEYEASRA